MPNLIADIPQMSFSPSAPNVEYSQLQAYQPTAPSLDDANIPSYDCPPNYEEAMTMLRQQQNEHGSSTLSKSRYVCKICVRFYGASTFETDKLSFFIALQQVLSN